ncbi:MAG: DUF120 domain-containing protein [Candidatus Nanohaloarchaea archaeon]
MELEGEVTEGIGEGADYIGKEVYQDRFEEVLGFRPFPGTLNLEVDSEEREVFEKETESRSIEDVYEGDDRLSDVEVTPVEVRGIRAGLLRLEKTDHPLSIAEIVAPVKLRDELGLEDGDSLILSPVRHT